MRILLFEPEHLFPVSLPYLPVDSALQILYQHEVAFEGYGEMWPATRARMVVALLLYQLIMLVTFALKLAPAQAALTAVVVMPLTFAGMKVMEKRYNSVLSGVVPLEVFHKQSADTAGVGSRKQSADTVRVSVPEKAVLPFLHPGCRPERPEELLSGEVSAEGICPLVEPDIVPPAPPPEADTEGGAPAAAAAAGAGDVEAGETTPAAAAAAGGGSGGGGGGSRKEGGGGKDTSSPPGKIPPLQVGSDAA